MEPADVLKKYAEELLSIPVHQPQFIALLKKHHLLHGDTEEKIKAAQTPPEGVQILVGEIERSLVNIRDDFDKLILVMKEYNHGGMEELAKKMETENPSGMYAFMCMYNNISIPLKPYFKDFYWSISNIYHGVYLVYTPSHRNVLTLVPLM